MNVLVITTDNGMISKDIMNSYCTALEESGCSVIKTIVTGNAEDKWLSDILQSNADLAIAYGLNGLIKFDGYFILRKLNIPVILLHYDNTIMYLDEKSKNEMKQYPDYYYNFIWDDYCLNIMKNFGIKNCYKIFLAADTKLFFYMNNIKSENNICFVGNIDEARLNLTLNNHVIDEFIEEAVKIKCEKFHIPLYDICFELMKSDKYKIVNTVYINQNYDFWNKIYFLLSVKASVVLRKFLVMNVNDDIDVYGGLAINNKNIHLKDKIDYGINLSKLYQKYKININISSAQLETSLNNRIFDVFASKGFLLTDYKEDLKTLFPEHYEKISYKNIAELNYKIEYYLKNEDERSKISEELYNHIIKNHTYKNRIQEIFKSIKIGQ